MTNEELAAIEAREKAATPGPWKAEAGAEVWSDDGLIAEAATSDRDRRDPKADANFIAHAREDIPKLLGEVKRLRDELRDERKARNAERRAREPKDFEPLW